MSGDRRKVLVTGAGGFIGKNLVRDQLARGHSVTAIDVDCSQLEAMHFEGDLSSRRIDIRSSEEIRPHLSGQDTVFHLAAAHLEVHEDEAYFHDVNVRATSDIVRIAAEEGVGRFVHCSTAGVYGPLKSLPADEGTPAAPDIPYEKSKLAAEQAVREAATKGGLSCVIVRPAWVYGPLCPRTLKLIRTIANRRFFFIGNGDNQRHPIYITDMLDAFERAATRALPTGETIIAAGPETVTVRRLVELIVEELGLHYDPLRLPTWLMYVVCLTSEKTAGLLGRTPPFSRRSLKFFNESSGFDISKAMRMLDFHPSVDTRQGLRLTIQYYREQGIL